MENIHTLQFTYIPIKTIVQNIVNKINNICCGKSSDTKINGICILCLPLNAAKL